MKHIRMKPSIHQVRWVKRLWPYHNAVGTWAAVVVGLLLLLTPASLSAQTVALKTDLAYWATTTPNASLEVGLSPRFTLDLLAAYNPWTFSNDRKMRCWLAQPSLRYWLCERFEGHFFGVHAHAAQYFGGFHRKRYDGYLAGGGISYGYDWILSPHWNVEAEVGVGYARMWWDESERAFCEKCSTPRHRNYVGPTKLGLTFSYLF